MAAYDGRRDRNMSDFAPIVPPGVGNAVYQGVVRRGMGGGTEQGETIY